jgi:hypothetical protein
MAWLAGSSRERAVLARAEQRGGSTQRAEGGLNRVAATA